MSKGKRKNGANGKVIHITDEKLHKQVKKFCEKNKVSMTDFAQEMMKLGMDAARGL